MIKSNPIKKISKFLLKKDSVPCRKFRNNFEEFFLSPKTSYPSDDRMHLSHCVMREIWNGNFSAPIKQQLVDGAKVLDVGCGSGSWICEMSSDYPNSQFIGLDMLTLFPTVKPFNVQFIQYNLFNGLPFSDNTFDYIHMQTLIFDITESQWEQFVYRELTRVCKVGGWIEIADPDFDLYNSGPITDHVINVVRTKFNSRMINMSITLRHESLLKSTSRLTNICHEKRKYKFGIWSGTIGKLSANLATNWFKSFLLSLESDSNDYKSFKKKIQILIKLLKGKGANNNDIDDIIRKMDDEFEIYNTWSFTHRFYAQKI